MKGIVGDEIKARDVWPSAGYSARARTSGRIGFRPGPMVDDPALGLNRLRISIDAVPVLQTLISAQW